MAEAKPIKRGATGFEEFGATDTFPATSLPALATISPSQITSDENDYAPTDWETADVVRLSFDSDINAVTGLAAWTTGKPKLLLNIGANPGYFPAEHAGSSAANRIAGVGDNILEGYGSMLVVYDSASSRVMVLKNTFNFQNMSYLGRRLYFDVNAASTNQSDHQYLGITQAGTGAGNAIDGPTTALFSAWTLSTGTTTTGSALVYLLKNSNAFAAYGGGHLSAWGACYVPVLSNGTNTYTIQAALTGAPNSTTLVQNNTVGLRYSSGINSGKWEAFSRDNAGSESVADTGITVATNTMYFMQVWVNKSRTEARYMISNGSTIYTGRITGNMPSAVVCGTRCIVAKTAGTTNRNASFLRIGGAAIYQ